MADNDLKIWQNHLLSNPFHMVDVKFDLVLRPISYGNLGYALYRNFILSPFQLMDSVNLTNFFLHGAINCCHTGDVKFPQKNK